MWGKTESERSKTKSKLQSCLMGQREMLLIGLVNMQGKEGLGEKNGSLVLSLLSSKPTKQKRQKKWLEIRDWMMGESSRVDMKSWMLFTSR